MNLSGANRRDVDYEFVKLGGVIAPVNSNGEVEYRHPSFVRPIRFNSRRKDIPRAVSTAVMKLMRRR